MTLSPLARRRLANYRANRRGYVATWIFLAIFTITLFAELIASDRPIVLVLDGELFLPVYASYSEAEIGGTLDIEADFRDPYVQSLITDQDGWMLWPPIRFSYKRA